MSALRLLLQGIVLIVIIDTIVIIVIIVIIDTIDEIDMIDAIKYHLSVHGLKANYPTNSPIKSRLQRFFSLINEIILSILLLLEKVIKFVTSNLPGRGAFGSDVAFFI